MNLYEIESRYLESLEGKQEVVATCYICGKEIYQGEQVYDDGAEMCCMDCINSMSAKQFIEKFLRESFTEAEG